MHSSYVSTSPSAPSPRGRVSAVTSTSYGRRRGFVRGNRPNDSPATPSGILRGRADGGDHLRGSRVGGTRSPSPPAASSATTSPPQKSARSTSAENDGLRGLFPWPRMWGRPLLPISPQRFCPQRDIPFRDCPADATPSPFLISKGSGRHDRGRADKPLARDCANAAVSVDPVAGRTTTAVSGSMP